MIIDDKKNIIIKEPKNFNELDVDLKNEIYEKLIRGLLLFYIPEKYKNEDRKIKNAYKAGFLDELYKQVYGDDGKAKERYELISEKYHLFYTNRMYNLYVSEYKKLCI